MLTFFRRIRKGLLGSGATSKYILYAIGEIALVVIGILIALQINNWNEWRKERIKEKLILYDIKQNIEGNLSGIFNQRVLNQRGIASCEVILGAIQHKFPYSDTLRTHFARAIVFRVPNPFNSAYEALKNTGLDIIKSEGLRNEIIELFDVYYDNFEISLTRLSDEDVKPNLSPFLISNFRMYRDENDNLSVEPNDYLRLLDSSKFENIIYFLKTNHETFLRIYEQQVWKSGEVLEHIKDELGE